MLVSTKNKQLVLKVRNPNQVMTVIPTAREFSYKGQDLLAVPHRLDEVRVLNNIGIPAPSPIAFQYAFPGKFTPFEAQRITAAFATLNKRCYILNDLGTGKTMASLWAVDWLMKVGAIRRVAIFCPLSTMERTWGDELFESFPDRTFHVVHGSAKRRGKMLAEDRDFYIINHHGCKVKEVVAGLAARDDIDLVIIDELAVFRNTRSDLHKALSKVVKGRDMVWGMTGTPTPQAPTDAYAQCKLITPSSVPQSFTKFRDMTMYKSGPYNWFPKKDAMDTVYAAMQPAVRFTRDDCVDLPEAIYMTRECPLSPEQSKAYSEMHTKLKTEYDSGQITAANAAVKALKLVQIACGVAYGRGDKQVVFPSPSRMNELLQIIEEAQGKVIIFVPFTGALNMIAEGLRTVTTVAVIDGSVPKGQRDVIFYDFQKTEEPRVLVAQPAAMSHGLTLTEANTIVWYAPPVSNDTYIQANGRITRPGQKLTQFIIHIQGTPIERKMYKRLAARGSMQDLLLDTFANA